MWKIKIEPLRAKHGLIWICIYHSHFPISNDVFFVFFNAVDAIYYFYYHHYRLSRSRARVRASGEAARNEGGSVKKRSP